MLVHFLFLSRKTCVYRQFPGCPRSAKYGPRDEPPIACQLHKKAGQFTVNRRGELLKATRDGNGKPAETFVLLLLLLLVFCA